MEDITITSDQISDSTAIGRSILTASDAETIRDVISCVGFPGFSDDLSATSVVRSGDVLSNILDVYTGEPVSYSKVTNYVDGTPMTDLECDGILYVKLGIEYFKRCFIGGIYVDWFGATGDGIVDDTLAIQRAIDACWTNSTLIFSSKNYNFSSVILATPQVNIQGNGSILLGIIAIGADDAKIYNSTIAGITFTNATPITIRNVRRLYVQNNTFIECDKCVYLLDSNNAQHVNAQIEVHHNFFQDVNYCMYGERRSTATWQMHSDCSFENNVVNNSIITSVYFNGMDGFKYNNNVIFQSIITYKKNHIKIEGRSDWIVISGNNFFESGEESIYLENCNDISITGNNFAWCCQNDVFSLIKIVGTITGFRITGTGNTIYGFSGNVIDIASTCYGRISFCSNNIAYSDTYTNYRGTTDLSTFTHFVINAPNDNNVIKEDNNINIVVNFKNVNIGTTNNTITSFIRHNTYMSVSYVTKTLTAIPTIQSLFLLRNSRAVSVETYSGQIIINCRQGTGSGALNSNYILSISKPSTTDAPQITIISSHEPTAGTDATRPKFTFSIASNILKITPKSSLLTGTCYFYAQSEGDLILSE